MRKAYDKHEDHRDVGGTYLASKPKRVPVITFVAQRERAADEAADNLDHRVKGEEGGQQIKDLEVKRIKMGKEEERAGQRIVKLNTWAFSLLGPNLNTWASRQIPQK